MGNLLDMLHPPGWTILQTIGSGAVLYVGVAIGKFVVNTIAAAIKRSK